MPDTISNNSLVCEETLILPGLTKEYRIMHISDVHVVACYDWEDEKVQDATRRRVPFFYNSSQESQDRLAYFVDEANRIAPDAVVMTGDIIDFPSAKALDVLKENVNRVEAPVLYCVGNHDWSFDYEWHTPQAHRVELPKFKSIAGTNSFCNAREFDEFIIVALMADDGARAIYPQTLEAFKEVLRNNTEGKPVLLAMHVPLCAGDYPENTLKEKCISYWRSYICIGREGVKPDAVTREFIDIINDPANHIGGILAGHVHFTHKDRINDHVNQYICREGKDGNYSLYTLKGYES